MNARQPLTPEIRQKLGSTGLKPYCVDYLETCLIHARFRQSAVAVLPKEKAKDELARLRKSLTTAQRDLDALGARASSVLDNEMTQAEWQAARGPAEFSDKLTLMIEAVERAEQAAPGRGRALVDGASAPTRTGWSWAVPSAPCRR